MKISLKSIMSNTLYVYPILSDLSICLSEDWIKLPSHPLTESFSLSLSLSPWLFCNFRCHRYFHCHFGDDDGGSDDDDGDGVGDDDDDEKEGGGWWWRRR